MPEQHDDYGACVDCDHLWSAHQTITTGDTSVYRCQIRGCACIEIRNTD